MGAWLPGMAVLLAAAACTGYYFHRVTGHFTFPWTTYWRQWSICPPFVFGRPNDSVHYQFADQLVYNRDYETMPYVGARTPVGFLPK